MKNILKFRKRCFGVVRFQKKLIINVIFPLFFGGLIYIFWRPDTIIMFRWFKILKIIEIIDFLRENLGFAIQILPDWFLYSLPNAPWVYSLTFLMLLFWYNEKGLIKYPFILLGPILGIGSEIAQHFGIIPGVFCPMDLVFCILASALSFVLFYEVNRVEKERAIS